MIKNFKPVQFPQCGANKEKNSDQIPFASGAPYNNSTPHENPSAVHWLTEVLAHCWLVCLFNPRVQRHRRLSETLPGKSRKWSDNSRWGHWEQAEMEGKERSRPCPPVETGRRGNVFTDAKTEQIPLSCWLSPGQRAAAEHRTGHFALGCPTPGLWGCCRGDMKVCCVATTFKQIRHTGFSCVSSSAP